MRSNSSTPSYRSAYFAGFAICAAMLAYAVYAQYGLGIEPCPLCMFQRGATVVMGIFFLIGALHNPARGGRRVYALLVLLGACAGIGVAAYHLWVQAQPPNPLAGCTPGWNYWVENYSLKYAWLKTFQAALTAHADCAEVNWTFLGVSMPFWTLIAFVTLGAGAVWAGFRRR